VDTYTLVRPLLFRIPPDTAHELAKIALRRQMLWRLLARPAAPDERLRTDLAGLTLASPIGLAPGFDKSGDLVPSIARLGFGYVVVGSITPEPRRGNPKPRLLRYVDRKSLANCMGMPNVGLEEAARLLSRPRPKGVPVIASVAGFSPPELLHAAATIEPHVDAIEIGLVCRHTPETFDMAERSSVAELAQGLARQRTKPVFVKLPPHFTEPERQRSLSIVDVWADAGLDGVSLSGTRQIDEPRLSMGAGGLAGKATTDDALRILDTVATRARSRLAIKASGGVFDGQDAYRFLQAGATAVELYSAFIYRGWNVARAIARELAEELDQHGYQSVGEIRRDVAPAAA
jgi:dihydroorotate dehydrogenase